MSQVKTTKAIKNSKPKEVKITKPIKAKVVVKKESVSAKKTGDLTVNVFDMSGKSVSTISLPKEIFGEKPNKDLLRQAIHIYEANSKPSTAHTKTRGEVRGGGAKPWKQKGTGNARAGSRRSPLWVGGGITFGPRTKTSKLSLPTKMKHKALISALSAKRESDDIRVIKNLEKVTPKTKIISNLLLKLETKGSTLFITSAKNENMKLATRNIQKVTVNAPQNLNAYEILKTRNLLISEESIARFASKRSEKNSNE